MKNFYLLCLFLFTAITLSCGTNKGPKVIQKCKPFSINYFSEAIIVEKKQIKENDTLSFYEIRYECVFNSTYTKKGMYDRFGKWDVIINPELGKASDMVWKDVKLFEDDTLRFQVAAGGIESRYDIYASVMVFDQYGNDMLREGSPYRDKLIGYFSEYILNDNPENDTFYKAF